MKIRFLIFMVLCLSLAVAASAATEYLKLATMGAQGWVTTIRADSSGRGGVYEKEAPYGGEMSGTFMFTNGSINRVANPWATISTAQFDGVQLSRLTTLTMRVSGFEGAGAEWQPPHFAFALTDSVGNHRCAEWIPWADGVPRDPGNSDDGHWNTYDALVDGQWYIPWYNSVAPHYGRFSTVASMLSTFPELVFVDPSAIGGTDGFYGLSFNVGYACWATLVNQYSSDARGLVDWFDVGIDGATTRYYLNEVPEPASLAALAAGLIGFLGIRRRF